MCPTFLYYMAMPWNAAFFFETVGLTRFLVLFLSVLPINRSFLMDIITRRENNIENDTELDNFPSEKRKKNDSQGKG